MKEFSSFSWKLFWLLLVAGLIGALASMPMLFDLVDAFVPAGEQAEIEANLPLPIPVLIFLGLLQNSVVFGGAIFLGLRLSQRIGTGAVLLSAWLDGHPVPNWRRTLAWAAVAGLLLGLALSVIDAIVFLPNMPPALAKATQSIPLWKRLLAGVFYGGITEEIVMRLFLFTLIAWSLGLVWKGRAGRPAVGAFWAANIIVAIAFALGHLPATAAIAPLTAEVVARSFVLNGLASLTFGYLYWTRGLEAAMAAHASAHVGLQPLGPALVAAVAP